MRYTIQLLTFTLTAATTQLMSSSSEHPIRADESTVEVVIVGAGLAGLVTAYELQKRGIETRLIEARSSAGGRVSTMDYGDGLLAEYGMQEIWEQNPLLNIAAELGTEVQLRWEECAHSSFMHDGRLYPAGDEDSMRQHWGRFLSSSESDALENWLSDAKALHERARTLGLSSPEIRALQDESLEDWISRSGLPRLAQAWLRRHIEVELASEWDQVSALSSLLEMDIFFDGGAACYSLEGGNARLIDALVSRSGPITTSARVRAIRRIDHEGKRRTEVSYLKDDRVETILAKRVVVTVPFYRLPQILFEPPLSPLQDEAIRTLGMGQYVVVHLIMNARATELVGTGTDAVPEFTLTDGPLGYLYGFVAENETRSVFSLLVYGASARSFHNESQSKNAERVSTELDALIPGFSKHVIDTHFYTYHPGAIAAWRPGRSPLDAASAALRESRNGLYFAGDYILGSHSDSAVRSGAQVAEKLALALRPTLTSILPAKADSERSQLQPER